MQHSKGFITLYATVTFALPGFHQWPQPTEHRDYLGQRHRHLFKFEISVEVKHHEREVEYHDLLNFSRSAAAAIGILMDDDSRDFGGRSCESILLELLDRLIDRYPDRCMTLKLFEDGEVGAALLFQPVSPLNDDED